MHSQHNRSCESHPRQGCVTKDNLLCILISNVISHNYTKILFLSIVGKNTSVTLRKITEFSYPVYVGYGKFNHRKLF